MMASGCGDGDQQGTGSSAGSPVTADSEGLDSDVDPVVVDEEEDPPAESPVTADSQWLEGDGDPVVVDEVCEEVHMADGVIVCRDRGALVVQSDDGECGFDGTFFLLVEDMFTYVRDSRRVPADMVNVTSGVGVEVPEGARDTGYHTDQVRLWVSEASGQEAAYLVGPDGTAERWPRLIWGCA
jgi:ribosomal protein L27